MKEHTNIYFVKDLYKTKDKQYVLDFAGTLKRIEIKIDEKELKILKLLIEKILK